MDQQATAVCSNGIVPNGPLMNTIYTNFAPRFGISYSPTSKMVIRAGYGIFYTQDIGNAYFDMARNIAGRVTVNKPERDHAWESFQPDVGQRNPWSHRDQHRQTFPRPRWHLRTLLPTTPVIPSSFC